MRSGTTLFRAMLAQHSAIASGLETHWFDIDWPNQQARGSEPLKAYLHRIGEFFEIGADWVDGFIDRADSAEIFLDLFMNAVARRDGKRRWVEALQPVGVLRVRVDAYWSHIHVLGE